MLRSLLLVLAATVAFAPPAHAVRLQRFDQKTVDAGDAAMTKFCTANPAKCTCAVASEFAFRDTPEGKSFSAACVGRLLSAKNTWKDCYDRTVSWRGGVSFEGKKTTAEYECSCMANRKPSVRKCLAWAGVDEDYGSPNAKFQNVSWMIVDHGPAYDNARRVCIHSGRPGDSPCRWTSEMEDARTEIRQVMPTHEITPAAVGRWVRTSTPAPRLKDAEWASRDRDNADSNEITGPGGYRLLRKGTWTFQDPKKGWSRGELEIMRLGEAEGGAEVSRRTGPWTFWDAENRPASGGEFMAVGPSKRSLRKGTWIEVDDDGAGYREVPYRVRRDPAADLMISEPFGVMRGYVAADDLKTHTKVFGEGGRLKSITTFGEEQKLEVGDRVRRDAVNNSDSEDGEAGSSEGGEEERAPAPAQPAGPTITYLPSDRIELDEQGRPVVYLQRAWKNGRWWKNGLGVEWSEGRVAEVIEYAWEVPVSRRIYAPTMLDQLPWRVGDTERAGYGLFVGLPDAGSLSGLGLPDRGRRDALWELIAQPQRAGYRNRLAWAVVRPSPADLATGNYQSLPPAKQWLGLASANEEYRLKKPVPNRSQVVCQTDRDCGAGESCEGNACYALSLEGWRRDKTPPFITAVNNLPAFHLPCNAKAEDECGTSLGTDALGKAPWVARGLARFDADGRLDQSVCHYRHQNTAAGGELRPWNLVWQRRDGTYEPVALDAWNAEQLGGTPEDRVSARACFNIPLPDEVRPDALTGWLKARMLGRGMDEALLPLLDGAPEAPMADCSTAPVSEGGLAWQSTPLAYLNTRGQHARGCVPLLTAWKNDLIRQRVNKSIRELFEGANEHTTNLGRITFGARDLVSLTVRNPAAEMYVWDLNSGAQLRFEDTFVPKFDAKAILALARKANPDAIKALSKECAKAVPSTAARRPFFGLAGTDEAPKVVIGERFFSGNCSDWSFEVAPADVKALLTPKSPLLQLL